MAQLKAAKALLGDGTGGLSFCDEQLEAALYERVLTPLVEATLGALPQQPSNATSSPQLRSWDRVAWGLSAVPVLGLAARSGLWTPGAEQCGRVLVHLDSGSALEDREMEIVPAVMAGAAANSPMAAVIPLPRLCGRSFSSAPTRPSRWRMLRSVPERFPAPARRMRCRQCWR